MFRKNLLISVIFASLIFFTSQLFAQDVTQDMGKSGDIDWTDLVVKATGIGSPNPKLPPSAQRKSALRAAQLDAMRNILETLQGALITSETTVENAITSSDVIKSRVEGVIKNFRIVKKRYMSDGSVEVEVEKPLDGEISAVLLPSVMGDKKPTFANLPPDFNPVEPQTYTGLIVDARGLGVVPAMVPEILDESGEGVYGEDYVPRESAVKNGVATYSKSLDQAKADVLKIGTNPLIIKGVKTSGLNKANIVVSDGDVERLGEIADNTDIYENCRVIIVVD